MDQKSKGSKTDNNRQLIIDVARSLILEQGVQGTSIADIAREAGISKGTLFYYYPAKNNLVYDITNQHFEEVTRALRRRVEESSNRDPEEVFRNGFATIIGEETRGRLNLYLVQDAVTGNEELRERFKEKYQEWRDDMESFLKLIFPGADPEELRLFAYIIVASLDGLIIQWLLDPDRVPVDEIASLLSRLMRR